MACTSRWLHVYTYMGSLRHILQGNFALSPPRNPTQTICCPTARNIYIYIAERSTGRHLFSNAVKEKVIHLEQWRPSQQPMRSMNEKSERTASEHPFLYKHRMQIIVERLARYVRTNIRMLLISRDMKPAETGGKTEKKRSEEISPVQVHRT